MSDDLRNPIEPFIIDKRDHLWTLVDDWIPRPEDKVLNYNKNAIVMPICEILSGNFRNAVAVLDSSRDEKDIELDSFVLTKKKCYNKEPLHMHICNYVNFWLKYYDVEKEYLLAYAKIKMQVDYDTLYDKEMFKYDIKRLLLTPMTLWGVNRMVEDNYSIALKYQSYMEPSLQYSDKHGKIMMAMSLVMNMLIPIVVHYVYIHNLDANSFLLEIYDIVLGLSNVDISSKLYDTCYTNISKNVSKHGDLWGMQDIRGINATTHSMHCVDNIILDIMPKYAFSGNLVSLNSTSIKNSLKYKITDVPYEYDFVSFSSSANGDEDNNSEFDKYESYLVVQNEGFLIQNRVNSKESMKEICMRFGPFINDEVQYYRYVLTSDGGDVRNTFQQTLISNLFFKYFGEPASFRNINSDDYIKLMIAAKRLLITNGMIILPYVISSKINTIQNRKSINKKEFVKLEADPSFSKIMQMYQSAKIREFIISLYATIISSEFCAIDFFDNEVDGKIIPIISDIIFTEINNYIILVNS